MTPCPRCSAPVDPAARFCTECGTWVVHPATPMTGVPIPSAFAAPASFIGGGANPTLNSSEMTTPQGQAPKSGVVGPQRTDIKSVPPPAALRKSEPPARTDVGRLSPLASSAYPAETPTAIEARAIQPRSIESRAIESPPQSNVAKTLVDTPSSTPAHTVGKSKRPLGAFLVSFQYEPLGNFWPLAVGPNLVGRSGLGARPDLDIGLADTTVSTEQAIIHVEPGHVGIEDRSSKNGTFVNGRPLLSGVRAPLRHGDRVRFGSFEVIVVLVPT